MTLSAEQAEQVCGSIESDLGAFQADSGNLHALRRALRAILGLRERYHDNEGVLSPYIDRLRTCRKRLREAIRAASVTLTAEYLQASRALTACRQRREACRDALVELARADGVIRFESPDGSLDVRHFRTMTLPRPGSDQRDALCRLISECGCWEAVALPNGAKLLQAMDDGVLTPEQAERIAALCTVRDSFRLSPHREA